MLRLSCYRCMLLLAGLGGLYLCFPASKSANHALPPCTDICMQATEKQAQRPVPPPEAFSPFSSRKAGDRSAFDPAKLGAAAEKAAETLTAGSLQKVSRLFCQTGTVVIPPFFLGVGA